MDANLISPSSRSSGLERNPNDFSSLLSCRHFPSAASSVSGRRGQYQWAPFMCPNSYFRSAQPDTQPRSGEDGRKKHSQVLQNALIALLPFTLRAGARQYISYYKLLHNLWQMCAVKSECLNVLNSCIKVTETGSRLET